MTDKPTNPSWEECKCEWGRESWQSGVESEEQRQGNPPEYWAWGERFASMETGRCLHHLVLELDGDRPLEAVTGLLAHINDDCIPRCEGFTEVMAQHNWSDPVGAMHLAWTLDHLLEESRKANGQAWRHQLRSAS